MTMKEEVRRDHQYQSQLSEYRDSLYEYLSTDRMMVVLTVAPALALFSFVSLIPMAWAISGGFFEISAFSPVWTWVGTQNYQETLSDPTFWAAVERSLIFAAGSVALQLILGTGFALLLNRSFKFNNLARSIALLPYLVPTAVLGYVTLWMSNSQFGIINQLLLQAGLIESYIPWFASIDLVMPAVIVTNSWKQSIFVTIMVLARLQAIPDSHYEAAKMAGASAYQQFRDITLPNLKGVIFIVLLLRSVWQFNKFDIIDILTKGGPGEATTTVPIYAYKVAFVQAELGKAAAISTFLFIMLVVTAVIYFRTLEPSKEVRA